MDASGVESSAAPKKIARSDPTHSVDPHRDELAGRVNNVPTVTKENGFTSYNTDVQVT